MDPPRLVQSRTGLFPLMANSYTFLQAFSAPLYALTFTGTRFLWNTQAEDAFRALKPVRFYTHPHPA